MTHPGLTRPEPDPVSNWTLPNAWTPKSFARSALSLILTGHEYWTNYAPEAQKIMLKYLGLDPAKNYSQKAIQAAVIQAAQNDPQLGEAVQVAAAGVEGGGGTGVPGAPGAGTTTTTTNPDGTQSITIPGVGTFTLPDYNGTSTTAADTRGQQKAKNVRDRNLEGGYVSALSSWGIAITSNLQTLIDEAVNKRYSQATFLNYLRQTPEYQDQFTGIFAKDGTLKMSEAEYLAQKKQYEDIATQAGINWGEKRSDWAFVHNVSATEFADRAKAITMLRENKDFYTQFTRGLVQSGLAKPSEVTQDGILKFVLGEGNKAWYEELNLAQARYTATQAGIGLGKASEGMYAHLAPGQVQKIADKGLTPEELKAGFEATAQDLLTNIPLSRIQHYGLTKRDILQARFGGKKQAEVLQLMNHIQEQEKAFYADRATASIYATADGVQSLGGSGTKAAQ